MQTLICLHVHACRGDGELLDGAHGDSGCRDATLAEMTALQSLASTEQERFEKEWAELGDAIQEDKKK